VGVKIGGGEDLGRLKNHNDEKGETETGMQKRQKFLLSAPRPHGRKEILEKGKHQSLEKGLRNKYHDKQGMDRGRTMKRPRHREGRKNEGKEKKGGDAIEGGKKEEKEFPYSSPGEYGGKREQDRLERAIPAREKEGQGKSLFLGGFYLRGLFVMDRVRRSLSGEISITLPRKREILSDWGEGGWGHPKKGRGGALSTSTGKGLRRFFAWDAGKSGPVMWLAREGRLIGLAPVKKVRSSMCQGRNGGKRGAAFVQGNTRFMDPGLTARGPGGCVAKKENRSAWQGKQDHLIRVVIP